MWYPQNGSMAKGSRRRLPTAPVEAAVVSEAMIEPRKTPCCQLYASVTSGTVVAPRPPNRSAEIGAPAGSSHSGATDGTCDSGAVKRLFGWAAGLAESGVQSLPSQSVRCAGLSGVSPSHHTSPSSVRATLVNTVLRVSAATALALVSRPVPGATPNIPYSGLIACSRPSAPNFIQQMSSPIVSAFQPGSVGTSMARFVLPHALGNAPATYFTSPCGLVSLRINMCSASQPSSRAITDAMRSAKHFLPRSALPP